MPGRLVAMSERGDRRRSPVLTRSYAQVEKVTDASAFWHVLCTHELMGARPEGSFLSFPSSHRPVKRNGDSRRRVRILCTCRGSPRTASSDGERLFVTKPGRLGAK